MLPSHTRDAFDRGFYVEPPDGGMHAHILRWVRRDPNAHQLMLGGIGSGKTSELLMARDTITREGIALAWHVELDTCFDLDALGDGHLTTLAGLALLALLRAKREPVVGLAHDLSLELHASLRPDAEDIAGLVRPEYLRHHTAAPVRPAQELADTLAPLVSRLRPLRGEGDGVVLLVDALDRRGLGAFTAATQRDLPVLRALGVGLVVVGSLDWRHGAEDLRADQRAAFAELWEQPTWNPSEPDHLTFLRTVLDRRAPGVFSEEVATRLAVASGGVMRDLLLLAQRCLHEALDGRTGDVTLDHVALAIDAFREGALAGLPRDDRQALNALEFAGEQPGRARAARLHARGCVVLREGQWHVHPALRGGSRRTEAA